MKKISFFITVVVASVFITCCQPPKPGGGDIAPANNYEGEVKDIQIEKKDSSIEKALMRKHIEDSVKAKK